MLEIKPRWCLPLSSLLLICITVFLHTNEGLPPYIMKWIVVSFLLEEHNGHHRLTIALLNHLKIENLEK